MTTPAPRVNSAGLPSPLQSLLWVPRFSPYAGDAYHFWGNIMLYTGQFKCGLSRSSCTLVDRHLLLSTRTRLQFSTHRLCNTLWPQPIIILHPSASNGMPAPNPLINVSCHGPAIPLPRIISEPRPDYLSQIAHTMEGHIGMITSILIFVQYDAVPVQEHE